MREEVERLRRDLERVERERDRLRRENERLREQLDAARRAGDRQAAPFSKGPSGRPARRPGRKAGPAYGRQGQRPAPTIIDDVQDVPVPTACPQCGGTVDDTHVTAQYQEDLPPVRPVVRRFDVHIGRCRRCGRRVQGRRPLQTSDAVGAAAVQLGPQAVAIAASVTKPLGLSFRKIETVFADRFGLTVTRGALVRAVHRVATKAQPTYTMLCATVKTSAMVVADETGGRVHTALHWLWVFTTPDTTVYAILPGRGFQEAAAVLGADFAGILVREGWAPYRQFTEALHQTSWRISSAGHANCSRIIRTPAFPATCRIAYRERSPCAIATPRVRSLSTVSPWHAGTSNRSSLACSTGRRSCLTCSVLWRTSIASGARSSGSFARPELTPQTGAPSKPFVRR